MNKELKQCPFCGGEARLMHEGVGSFKNSYVECIKCYASSDHIYISPEYSSDDKAIELWNKRNTSKTTIVGGKFTRLCARKCEEDKESKI